MEEGELGGGAVLQIRHREAPDLIWLKNILFLLSKNCGKIHEANLQNVATV